MRRVFAGYFACALGSMAPRSAVAQVPVAQSLFEEGRRLRQEGKTAEACTRFAESFRLERLAVTLLNLAACHRDEGKTASAWVEFRQAHAISEREGRPDRAEEAQRQSQSLESQLSYVTFEVAWSRPGETVKLDGTPLGRSVWSAPLPVDPGKHIVTVGARAAPSYDLAIEVPVGPSTTRVPLREPDPSVEAQEAPNAIEPADPAPPSRPRARANDTWQTVGLGLGAAGIAAVGVGAVFGLVAIGENDSYRDKRSACPNDRCPTPEALNAANDAHASARTAATVSNVAFGVGAALLVSGTVVVLTTRRPSTSTASVSVHAGLAGAHLRGVF